MMLVGQQQKQNWSRKNKSSQLLLFLNHQAYFGIHQEKSVSEVSQFLILYFAGFLKYLGGIWVLVD